MGELPSESWCMLKLTEDRPVGLIEHLRIIRGLLEGAVKPDDPAQRQREERAFRRHIGPSCPA